MMAIVIWGSFIARVGICLRMSWLVERVVYGLGERYFPAVCD